MFATVKVRSEGWGTEPRGSEIDTESLKLEVKNNTLIIYGSEYVPVGDGSRGGQHDTKIKSMELILRRDDIEQIVNFCFENNLLKLSFIEPL